MAAALPTLPYPGYSWSLTQHAVKVNSRDVYAILGAALAVRTARDPGRAANEYLAEMVRAGATGLTSNVRGARAQPWRDYQQILPELGLMISTKVSRLPTPTPLGLMFYDGTIGFEELIATQALRYQYPNGQKTDIQSRLQSSLRTARIVPPRSRLELEMQRGVLVRPAVLILRVLIELERMGQASAVLSVDDVAGCLLPIAQNQQWPQALDNLRRGNRARAAHARRNVQDWFKLLGKSAVFETRDRRGGATVGLSPSSLANITQVESLAAALEDPAGFWIPPSHDLRHNRLDWFRYYGNPDPQHIWALPEEVLTPEYIAQNYVIGMPADDTERERVAPIQLRDFAEFRGRVARTGIRSAVDQAAILAGRMKTAERSVLHDRIIARLGEKLRSVGYEVKYDPDSIDVFARREGSAGIVEVKTIGPRNIATRLRLGTGQIVEYRRRLEREMNLRAQGVLVVSAPALPRAYSHWLDVLANAVRIGLLGFKEGAFVAHTHGPLETAITDP